MCGLFHVCDGLIKKEEKDSKEIVNCLSVLHAVCPCIRISESPKKNQNGNEKNNNRGDKVGALDGEGGCKG